MFALSLGVYTVILMHSLCLVPAVCVYDPLIHSTSLSSSFAVFQNIVLYICYLDSVSGHAVHSQLVLHPFRAYDKYMEEDFFS